MIRRGKNGIITLKGKKEKRYSYGIARWVYRLLSISNILHSITLYIGYIYIYVSKFRLILLFQSHIQGLQAKK